jgi:hypothetical protein
MEVLMDLLLLLAAFTLLLRSNSERDEVWQLCLRLLAAMAVLAVISNVRGLPISLLLLGLALWLPNASRFEALQPPGDDR